MIISCDEVFLELQKKEDELSAWSVERQHIFELPDDETIDEVIKIMAQFRNFGAKGDGRRNSADPFVIAHAARRKAVVVTDEQRQEGIVKATKPPKIPNVCHALGLRCVGTVGFLSAIGVSI